MAIYDAKWWCECATRTAKKNSELRREIEEKDKEIARLNQRVHDQNEEIDELKLKVNPEAARTIAALRRTLHLERNARKNLFKR